MRILIDLQACQCGSRFRGIGRYSMSLAQSMARQLTERDHEVWLLLSDKFPDTIDSIASLFDDCVPRNRLAIFSTPGAISNVHPENSWRVRAAELVREEFISQINPDFVHVASLVEGWGDDTATSIGISGHNQKTAATLYDLIPYVLPDAYLVDPVFKKYYLRKLDSLKRADILFAISEYSREEAINLLGVNPDHVVNISAAIDSTFKPRSLTPETRQELLSRCGILKPFVLYAPGGFDSRKNIENLIEAFSLLPESVQDNYQLVLASKLYPGQKEYLTGLATKHGLNNGQLVLTDYVTDDDLVALYSLCRVNIFPSTHEGFGLPALEGMACGAAVIGSDTTSIPEVIGRQDALFNPYSAESISGKMHEALTNENFNQELRAHAQIQHTKFSWDHSAEIAVAALEAAFKHSSSIHQKSPPLQPSVEEQVKKIPLAIAQEDGVAAPTASDIVYLKDAITRNRSRLDGKQLLVDISELVRYDAKSGIQRVVRSILRHLLNTPPSGYKVVPVYSQNGEFFQHAHQFLAGFQEEYGDKGADIPIEFSAGDIFLGLDLTAHLFPSLNAELARMKEYGVAINYIVYDLTPLTHPQWHAREMTEAFSRWIASLVQYADNLVCISRAVAEDVNAWLGEHFPENTRRISITHFHLGADIDNSVPTTGMPDDAEAVLTAIQKCPSFLSVGTVEPRKGYAQLLEAFDLLWRDNVDVNLVIVGKAGWHTEEIVERLNSHPELNKRLFWLSGISDEYLEKIYSSVVCLIAASEGEGFGLPLIEAAKQKLPIIARDLLVFREVAAHHAYYFSGTRGIDLAEAIQKWLPLHHVKQHPLSANMPWLTWAQSTAMLLNKIIDFDSTPSLKISKVRFIRGEMHKQVTPPKPIAEYPLGEVIFFSANGNSDPYIRDGWAHPEEWGRWTNSNVATISFKMDNTGNEPLLLKLNAIAFVHEKHPEQRLEITINGIAVMNTVLTNIEGHTFELPIEMDSLPDRNGEWEIQFNTPNADSPLNSGLSPDSRLLGVGVISLQLSCR